MGWQSALEEWLDAPHKLGHLLGFDKLSEVHSEWIKLFINVPLSGQLVLQAHRNSYKTTSGLVALTLLYMLYPDIRILILRKSISNAEKLVMAMQKIFSSDIVRAWMYNRHGLTSLETAIWSRSQLTIACKKKITVEPSLQAMGIGTSSTGTHFDYIWSDDIVTDDDRYSIAERENTKNQVYELANIIEPLGSRVFTGTTWHHDDAFSILPEPKRYPIGSVKIVGIDDRWIEEQKKSMPNSLWCANYELKHVFDGDVIGAFRTIPKFTSQYLVAFIDSSYSDKRKSDHTACAIVGFVANPAQPKNYWNIEFTGMSWEKSITNADVIRDLLNFLHKFQPIDTCLESQLGDSTQIFIDKLIQTEKDMKLEPRNHWTWKHQKSNKHERISMSVDANKDRIFVLDGTNQSYLKYIMDYSKGETHDDEPDSLAGGIDLWQNSKALAQYAHAFEMARKKGLVA